MTGKHTFSVWTPFEVAKSANGGGSEPATARIGGIISSAAKDFQGEEIAQGGVDWSYFLKHGWFNYEHKQGPENVLGHPETVTKGDANGKDVTRVEGVLYLHKPKARQIYDTALAMQKAGGARQLGFSVEGQVEQRLGKKIIKARVLNVALTAHPVNPDARLEIIAKAAGGYNAGGSVGYQEPASAGSGSLSSLVPQSLAAIPSIASFASYSMRRKRMSVNDLALLLASTFPQLSYATALNVAVEVARVVR